MMNLNIQNIGEYISSFRKERKKTMKELADVCGVSVPYIHDIEHGRRIPTDKILLSIAEFLGVEYWKLRQVRDITRGKVILNLQGKSKIVQNMAIIFATKYNNLPEKQVIKIIKILEEKL